MKNWIRGAVIAAGLGLAGGGAFVTTSGAAGNSLPPGLPSGAVPAPPPSPGSATRPVAKDPSGSRAQRRRLAHRRGHARRHAHLAVSLPPGLRGATDTPHPAGEYLYPAAPPPPGTAVPLAGSPGGNSPTATASGLSCYPVQSFFNIENSEWVSAELSYNQPWTGMLRARKPSNPGPWEQFQFCSQNGQWSIWSDGAGYWTTTEIADTGNHYAMLRARQAQIGRWEQYAIDCIGPSGGQDFVMISRANSNYVSTELAYTGTDYAMLRARRSQSAGWGPWETYWPFPGCP